MERSFPTQQFGLYCTVLPVNDQETLLFLPSSNCFPIPDKVHTDLAKVTCPSSKEIAESHHLYFPAYHETFRTVKPYDTNGK